MKYDVRTKKVIEVDNEELEQVLNNYKIKNGDTYNKLNSYNPFEAKHFSKISFTKSVHEALTKQVTDTSVFPYRTTCKVNGNIKNDKVEGTVEGSASLVGPNIALTAAHVCFIEYNKEWYTYENLNFRPGYNGKDDDENIDDGNYKGFSSDYEQIYFPSSYMINKDKTYDWAICVLKKPLGHYLGYFALKHYDNPEDLKQISVMATGYPAETKYGFNGKSQWESGGEVYETNDITFKFYGNIYQGYSGGPTWQNDDEYTMVGITSQADETSSYYGQSVITNRRIITLVTKLREQWYEANPQS